MSRYAKSTLIKVTSLILVFLLIAPSSAMAATPDNSQPYASKYLTAYNTYICRVNGGIQIWYEVMGTGDMDEIGVLSIVLYESSDNSNWSYVDTFLHEDYESMLVEDDWYHSSFVPYKGSANKFYKAYVCIWAGKNGGGDTRYMWATMVYPNN